MVVTAAATISALSPGHHLRVVVDALAERFPPAAELVDVAEPAVWPAAFIQYVLPFADGGSGTPSDAVEGGPFTRGTGGWGPLGTHRGMWHRLQLGG